jgi:glycosyltransferase involved in cell wall biosynthesis
VLYQHPKLTESFGRTAAEAMRAGCIPIVDARGGFLEQVTADSGFPCRTDADFAQALADLANPLRRQALSAAAVQRGDAMFSMAAFRQRLQRLWQSAADPAAPSGGGQ